MKCSCSVAFTLAAASAALAGLPFDKPGAAWRGEADFSTAKVYVATNATLPEIEAGRLLLRTIGLVAGQPDTTNVMPTAVAGLPASGIVIGWQGSGLVKPYAKALGLQDWRDCGGRDTIAQFTSGKLLFLAGNSPDGRWQALASATGRLVLGRRGLLVESRLHAVGHRPHLQGGRQGRHQHDVRARRHQLRRRAALRLPRLRQAPRRVSRPLVVLLRLPEADPQGRQAALSLAQGADARLHHVARVPQGRQRGALRDRLDRLLPL